MNEAINEFNVLFVDDDSQILALGQDILEKDMFDVDKTTDPREAYEMFLDNSYDAVISDHDMPYMTGTELYEKIRETDEEIPFFLHTGRDIQEVGVSEEGECLTEYYQKAGLDRYRELADKVRKCSAVYGE